jgi:hypothetical protein
MRRGEAEDVRRERIARWAIEAVRAGHKPGSVGHRYRGTYGEWPPAAWLDQAFEDARRQVAREREQAAERGGLFDRFGSAGGGG